MSVLKMNHVALVVDNLEKACEFYENVLKLEKIPAFKFDYPAQFYQFKDGFQLHLSEWEDKPSYRGHICIQVSDFNEVYYESKKRDIIDIQRWGKIRRLPEGAMQMFIKDPSENLIEVSCKPEVPVDESLWEDQSISEKGQGIFVSNRNDTRGYKSEDAKLY